MELTKPRPGLQLGSGRGDSDSAFLSRWDGRPRGVALLPRTEPVSAASPKLPLGTLSAQVCQDSHISGPGTSALRARAWRRQDTPGRQAGCSRPSWEPLLRENLSPGRFPRKDAGLAGGQVYAGPAAFPSHPTASEHQPWRVRGAASTQRHGEPGPALPLSSPCCPSNWGPEVWALPAVVPQGSQSLCSGPGQLAPVTAHSGMEAVANPGQPGGLPFTLALDRGSHGVFIYPTLLSLGPFKGV